MESARPSIPRFLYVASCYSAGDASAYHLLVTSDEEHDPETDAGSAAIVRLLAQTSERRDWFTTADAYREEVRQAVGWIEEELHELQRYSLPAVVGATGAWTPQTTDADIWGDAPRG